ncbi:MAG: cyclic nucleotide-binding domain-containing protein [Deltaproteobacteria bacterium]|nr:cyclic nucleotide-binding domain-containing protein [Deltaproteobacteria bacterium]
MVEVNDFKKLDIFNVFSEKQLAELVEITETKAFKKDAHVYERGKRADHIFVVINGLVSLNRFEPGEKIGISFEKREKGELFGTAAKVYFERYKLAKRQIHEMVKAPTIITALPG